MGSNFRADTFHHHPGPTAKHTKRPTQPHGSRTTGEGVRGGPVTSATVRSARGRRTALSTCGPEFPGAREQVPTFTSGRPERGGKNGRPHRHRSTTPPVTRTPTTEVSFAPHCLPHRRSVWTAEESPRTNRSTAPPAARASRDATDCLSTHSPPSRSTTHGQDQRRWIRAKSDIR